MPIAGKIAEYARAEMPETWTALATSTAFGEPLLERRILNVQITLFGAELTDVEQAALDELVAEYAGKCVALKLIGAGIDYWSKQPLSLSATGRNENKSYTDRSAALRDLAKLLLEQTRSMWPEVEALLPRRRVKRVANTPRVKEIEIAHTPNPYDFDAPFAPKTS